MHMLPQPAQFFFFISQTLKYGLRSEHARATPVFHAGHGMLEFFHFNAADLEQFCACFSTLLLQTRRNGLDVACTLQVVERKINGVEGCINNNTKQIASKPLPVVYKVRIKTRKGGFRFVRKWIVRNHGFQMEIEILWKLHKITQVLFCMPKWKFSWYCLFGSTGTHQHHILRVLLCLCARCFLHIAYRSLKETFLMVSVHDETFLVVKS